MPYYDLPDHLVIVKHKWLVKRNMIYKMDFYLKAGIIGTLAVRIPHQV